MGNENHSDRELQKPNERIQQMNMGGNPPPGRRPRRDEGPTNQPPMGPPPGMSPEGPPPFGGREEQPRSAPPNFTPEPPRMERGQEQGRQGVPFGGVGRPFGPEMEFGGRGDNRRIRELRGCINRFTFFWLFNGDGFWFYPTFVDDRFVRGFRWRRDRWVYDRIYIRSIFFFRCY